MLTTENFEAKLATKGDIQILMKKFKKKKLLQMKRKLKGRKKLNDLLGEVKLISTKRLAKKNDKWNGYSILNDVKYFTADGSQNDFIFQPLNKYFKPITNNVVM